MATQLIAPNPNIFCKPGWCLAYVNEAFGVRKVYGSATAAWFGSTTQHRDRDFPEGVWIPVWYALDNEPAGHVVLRAPDGSVYSTSDLTNTPHHHRDLADLEAYYAYYGMTLTYRGWTEDVEGTRVISLDGINYSGTITPQEDEDVANTDLNLQENTQKVLKDNKVVNGELSVAEALGKLLGLVQGIPSQVLFGNRVDGRNIVDTGRQSLANDAAILAALSGLKAGTTITAADIVAAIPEGIAQAVADELGKRLSGGAA